MQLGVEAEAADIVLRIPRPDRLHDAHRDQILRFHQCRPQPHRAFIFSIVVLGLPRLAPGLGRVEIERSVVHDGGRAEALFERGRVDKGLEGRAGLTLSLSHVIKLVAVEVESSDERQNCAIGRPRGHER